MDVELCTQEDFDEFYPIVSKSENFLKELKTKEVLYCVKQEELFLIRGMDEIDSVVLNIDLIPCLNSFDNMSCVPQDLDDLK